MNEFQQLHHQLARREFLSRTSLGLGAAALAHLSGGNLSAAEGLPGLPHFAPKAKRVIYLMQSGAPSHVDLFDYKPILGERRGEEIPESIHQSQKLSTMTANAGKPCLGAIAPFQQHGESGRWVSDFLPHTAEIADDLCFVHSMKTEAVNHAPAMTFLLTGGEQPGRPSMGAWLDYGLGSDTDDLPTFCVMTSRDREGSCGQLFYDFYWGSGFLPSRHQGVKFRGGGDPVLYLSNPPGINKSLRRDLLDGLSNLNQLKYEAVGDPEIQTRITQYEMAYRMQDSVPELTDYTTEPKHVLDMYGSQVMERGTFASNCMMARRLAERGVKFIQLMHSGWDQHQNLPTQLVEQCKDTDQPAAALVKDLKQRGLLDETLVIWGGEFGRTPFGQGDINNKKKHGRDHHPYCYSIWMAGGGVKPGISFGRTDEYGYNVVEDKVHVHDFQATVMHLLGIDHERLTFKFQGRHFRLTDIHGEVVDKIIS
ncbi:DUF1501 domain-containing protein [Planctomycetaceae bacterium]|jgi:hypothetical protein|nr:DUF1501 domain-containing protein [Planctomycetaceae bacterium]